MRCLGNREPCFDFHESRHYSRILSALEVPVIFCLPPFREIQKQMLQTEQWDEAAQRILDIYNKYKLIAKFMSRQKIKGITNRDQPYDYNQPKVISTITLGLTQGHCDEREVMRYLGKRALRSKGWS
jgi:hypothetical protein